MSFAKNLFLIVSFCLTFLHHVSSCDEHCADRPVFTPSRLVVKFGDPTSAKCFVCQRDCLNNLFDLEKSLGSSAKNGTTISWTVDRMTEWDTSAQCYYNNDTDYQCCTFLPITVYQPPDNVAISFVNHTGPMFEGHQYTLQCTVQDVAPVENLTVTFYRGQTALSQQQSNYNTEKTPVTEIFTLDINATKEDNGVQYWCEAELQLGPEGPQQPPVEISPKLTATVNYKPHLEGAPPPDSITVKEGNPLQLNCSVVGNPSPSYIWKPPSANASPSNSSIFTINSVTYEDEGLYTCSVSNAVGSFTVKIFVKVQGMLRRWDDSQKYLSDNPHLVCQETANCLVVFCIDFEIDEKHALMEQVAHQAIVMQFILDLARRLKVDPRGCFRQFFSQIKTADKPYQDAFDRELVLLKERVRSCAQIRMESAMKELEEEERQKRLGPGGLDPQEVYQSLPKEVQKSFDEKNIQMLQEAINKLDPEEGKYHLRRCIDSGLWVPDSGEGDDEKEEDEEDEEED